MLDGKVFVGTPVQAFDALRAEDRSALGQHNWFVPAARASQPSARRTMRSNTVGAIVSGSGESDVFTLAPPATHTNGFVGSGGSMMTFSKS